MKRLSVIIICLLIILSVGCTRTTNYDIVATTLPVYDFTNFLCEGTDLSVGRLVTENVSCLHDYTLHVGQMRMIEEADAIVISGVGLESFLADALHSQNLIDASKQVHLHSADHLHEHHDTSHEHSHDTDPHIWLSPENAKIMCENICSELTALYPEHQEVFQKNLTALLKKLDELLEYGGRQLSNLSFYELITFHDGFAYFAESFDLTILEAIEEESGSEASASEIIHLVELVETNALPAIFIERSGSNACAGIIHAETDAQIYTLDMAMAGDSYFDAMYHNIDTIKEALG